MPFNIDYRPKDFDEMIGNKLVVASLKSILKRDLKDIPHSIMFIGPSGCGKTTLARIVAKELGCNEEYDLIEIDAGSERGVETADRLKKSINYAPMKGKVRVFIIDEIQATSKKFQDSLLKTLEDSPSHTFFILCTTDPQKLLLTIKNRCAQYTVNKLNSSDMRKVINVVLETEEVKIGKEVISSIIESSDGCPRQALVILDQIIDMDEEEMLEGVRAAQIEEKQIIDLCRALINPKTEWDKIARIIKTIEAEPEKTRMSVMGYCNSILLSEDKKGGKNIKDRAAIIIEYFKDPFYSNKPLLTLACYNILFDE